MSCVFSLIPLVLLMLGLGACGVIVYPDGGRSAVAPLSLEPSSRSLALTEDLPLTVTGGVAPYQFSVDGVGTVDATSTYLRPWRSGESKVRVRDAVGTEVSSTLSLPAASVRLLASGALDLRQMTVDPNGDVYLLGSAEGTFNLGTAYGTPGSRVGVILRFQANGKFLWGARLGGGGASNTDVWNPWRRTNPIFVGSDPNPCFSGYSNGALPGAVTGSAPNADAPFVACFTSTGEMKWLRHFGTQDGTCFHNAIAATTDSIYLATCTASSLGGTQIGTASAINSALIKMNRATGAVQWASERGDGATATSRFYSVAVLSTGAVVTAGVSRDGANCTATASSFDPATGSENWRRAYTGAGNNNTFSQVIEGSDGDVLFSGIADAVVGTQIGTHGSLDLLLLKTSAAGAVRWINQMGAGVGREVGYSKTNQPYPLFAATNGGFVVVGQTTGTLGGVQHGVHTTLLEGDVYIAAFNAAGARVWAHQFGVGNGGGYIRLSNFGLNAETAAAYACAQIADGTLGGTQLGTSTSVESGLIQVSENGTLEILSELGDSVASSSCRGGSGGSLFFVGNSSSDTGGTIFGALGAQNGVVMTLKNDGTLLNSSQIGATDATVEYKLIAPAGATSDDFYVCGTNDSANVTGISTGSGTTRAVLSRWGIDGKPR